MTLSGELTINNVLNGELDTALTANGEYGDYVKVRIGDYYTGETEVTPTEETVVLATVGKVLADNITVNPIPPNYGLITVVGNHIMVS